MESYSINPEHIKTLIATFWHNGWRSATKSKEGLPSEEQTSVAIENGLLFNRTLRTNHDELVSYVIGLRKDIDEDMVVNAFLASLTSHRLDLRSALSSYVVAKNLSQHNFVELSGRCAICGLSKDSFEYDANILNFERFMWGGVRKDDLRYVAFDLSQFKKAPQIEAQLADKTLFAEILELLRNLPVNTTATEAAKQLATLKGNQSERGSFVDSLGVMGIMETGQHEGFNNRFVRLSERSLPNKHYIDRHYPACWWIAGDGINEPNMRDIFKDRNL